MLSVEKRAMTSIGKEERFRVVFAKIDCWRNS